MKSKLLMKSLLVAAGLCVGASNAWADNMTTMTGLLGLADNSNGFAAYKSKAVTLAAGESYQYTFVNYNKGASGTDIWENWAVEANDGTKYLDFRVDGGFWGELPSAASYTGSTNTSISSTATTWLQAYNGVTVTVTVSRSNDGTTFTVAHTATTNAVAEVASTTYSGTYTATIDGSANITFYLTNEDSHQIINKVVYTDASAVVTDYELKNIDLSQFDSYFSGSYSDGTATFTNSGSAKVWAKMALSDYFESINGTITNVNMKFKENVGGGGRIAIGIYGNNKSSWATNAYQDTGNSVSVWGIVGSNYARRIYYRDGSTYVNGVLTYDAEAAIEVDMDIINKKFTWIQDGTTRVNNQAFVDTEITVPQYLALYSWSATNTTTLSDMTMEIVYVEASYYTATFTNTTSGNTPSVTIYTDSERTSEIANGLLVDGTTYYYTAIETGYQNYNGEFTVSGSDPAVNFAMTAKAVYNYSVNAIDGASGIIKAGIVSGTCYAGESTSFYLPTCVLVDGKLYFTKAESSYKSETVSSNNQVFSYAYTEDVVDNVVFFVEGEAISGASESTPTGNQQLASKGHMGRGSNLNVTSLPAGVYTVYVKYINTNSGAHTLIVKAGETDVINATDITVRPTKSGNVTLTETTNITLTAAASSTSGVDYLYIVKTGVTGTIASSGYSSLASAFGLDFANATGLTAAYVVTKTTNEAVTLTSVDELPANSGVILKGESGAAYSIPVKADAAYSGTNLLSAAVTATPITANSAYILQGGQFHLVTADSDVPAGKAYLPASNVPSAARALGFIFSDEVEGISAVSLDKQNNEFYNLQGQRVDSPKKGLYIVNGTKVIIK